MKYTKINSAFILGSTSEIAKAICIELAKQGCKKFVLIARNKSKNNIFAQELIEKFNVEVTTKELDLLQIEKKYDQLSHLCSLIFLVLMRLFVSRFSCPEALTKSFSSAIGFSLATGISLSSPRKKQMQLHGFVTFVVRSRKKC